MQYVECFERHLHDEIVMHISQEKLLYIVLIVHTTLSHISFIVHVFLPDAKAVSSF